MASSYRFVLASASPARLRLLQAAGIDPEVIVSGVDEDEVGIRDPDGMVLELAARKAAAVAERCGPALVLGADSTLDLDGVAHGKPLTSAVAFDRWRLMGGRSGVLATGHYLLDTTTGASASAVARTVVHFASPTEAELKAYVATGEPLGVAGGFTLDGYSAPFISSVEGDPSNVIGLSLPLLRSLCAEIGVEWTGLWR